MSVETRKIIIGVLAAAGLYYLILYVFDKKKNDPDTPKQIPITDENIDVAVEAYSAALANQEDPATMEEMNKSFLQEYGISIKQRSDDGRLIIRNMAGNNIKIV